MDTPLDLTTYRRSLDAALDLGYDYATAQHIARLAGRLSGLGGLADLRRPRWRRRRRA